jgi:hypothetical protein
LVGPKLGLRLRGPPRELNPSDRCAPHAALKWADTGDAVRKRTIKPCSQRLPLKVLIEVQDGAKSVTGETVIVNLHGALISTSIELNAGIAISVYVYLTDKRTRAQVVHVDPENPMRCGIELEKPQNIWGVPLPPKDWEEGTD